MMIITLDGSVLSDLNWSQSLQKAREGLQEGQKVFWDLDLGLFNRLPKPISSESQLKTLGLSLEHFYQTVWPEFSKASLGLCLYKGPLDFSLHYPWNHEQQENFFEWCRENDLNPSESFSKKLYCRDAGTEYLNLLAHFIPESIDPYILLDAAESSDPFTCICLLDPERTDRFTRGLKGSLIETRDLIWKEEGLLEPPAVNAGLYLPKSRNYGECSAKHYEKALDALHKSGTAYRLIAEEHLITDWDGLDFLLADPLSISPMGKRKLLGFCAAGGTIVNIGDREMGLPQEIFLNDLKPSPAGGSIFT